MNEHTYTNLYDAYDLGWYDGYNGRDKSNPYEEDTDDWQDYEDGHYDGSKA